MSTTTPEATILLVDEAPATRERPGARSNLTRRFNVPDIRVPVGTLLPRQLWADLVKWAAGYRCESCGLSKEQLVLLGQSGDIHAHHIDKDKTNNRVENGMCLCPPCHGIAHSADKVGHPCEEGCTCGRHRRPSVPFEGGSSPCAPGCKCKRHEARYHGHRRSEQPCVNNCGRTTRRVTPGLCATCLHNAWYHRNKDAVNAARRRT